jgi:hypothetical protein
VVWLLEGWVVFWGWVGWFGVGYGFDLAPDRRTRRVWGQ